MAWLLPAFAVFVALLVIVKPLQWAAGMMRAEHTGFLRCLVSLVAASLLQAFGLTVPVYGNLVAFLLASAGFAGILGTTFVRGIGISVLHMIFSALLLAVLAFVFGVAIPAWISL